MIHSQSTILPESLHRALDFDASSPRPLSLVLSKASETPCDILPQHLSVRSVVSTTPSFAECLNRASRDLEVIGLGSCGSVSAIPGTEEAIKKGSDVHSMWNDFRLTNSVHNAFAEVRNLLQDTFPNNTIPRVPGCTGFYIPDHDFWQDNLQRFPSDHQQVGAAFTVQRILPLPKRTRDALIELYFDDEVMDEAKNDRENSACLVRVYLGENESNPFYDSLLNFPLRLNMIEDLEDLKLDIEALADEMAIALAVIRFQAEIDAMDTEFVLGSARATPAEMRTPELRDDNEPHSVEELEFKQRPIHLWVLDFDKAKRIIPAPENIDHLVAAFLGNDPYYPRPDVDRDLWIRFRNTYTKVSCAILERKQAGEAAMRLPQLFLDAVEAKIEEHKDWDLEQNIVLG